MEIPLRQLTLEKVLLNTVHIICLAAVLLVYQKDKPPWPIYGVIRLQLSGYN